jgi:tetratricopeptide (TPR) repeat protein
MFENTRKEPFWEYLEQGNRFWSRGEFEEAIASYRRAVELSPNSPQTHQTLADALNHQGKTSEAMEHYQKAINCSNSQYSRGYRPDYSTGPQNHGEDGGNISEDIYNTQNWNKKTYIIATLLIGIPFVGVIIALYLAGIKLLATILLGVAILCALLVSVAYWVDKANL